MSVKGNEKDLENLKKEIKGDIRLILQEMQKNREERLKELFTKVFKILDLNYYQFNTIYETNGDKRKEIIELEKESKVLGLYLPDGCKEDKDVAGVSVISLLATITDILFGKRFAVCFDEKDSLRNITGAQLVDGVEPTLEEEFFNTEIKTVVCDLNKGEEEVKKFSCNQWGKKQRYVHQRNFGNCNK